jgi:hypothetical protein
MREVINSERTGDSRMKHGMVASIARCWLSLGRYLLYAWRKSYSKVLSDLGTRTVKAWTLKLMDRANG